MLVVVKVVMVVLELTSVKIVMVIVAAVGVVLAVVIRWDNYERFRFD